MKHTMYRIFATIFILFIIPSLSFAQTGFVPCEGAECGTCDLVQMGNSILVWLIAILFVVFAVILAIAGFGLVTSGGNPAAKERAKGKFVNAIVGLIIVLIGWVLVDTVMRGLLSGGNGTITGFGPWSVVQCTTQTVTERANIIAEDTDLINAGLATTSATSTPPASNCGFDESNLVSIPGEGGHRAVSSVANAYVNMRSAAAARGINLSITSSYRPDSRQTELWDTCPQCQREGTVARPCSRGGSGSRHSSGLALDISSSGGRVGRCEVRNLCRQAGASFIMFYSRRDHVHCDWGGSGEVGVSCP